MSENRQAKAEQLELLVLQTNLLKNANWRAIAATNDAQLEEELRDINNQLSLRMELWNDEIDVLRDTDSEIPEPTQEQIQNIDSLNNRVSEINLLSAQFSQLVCISNGILAAANAGFEAADAASAAGDPPAGNPPTGLKA